MTNIRWLAGGIVFPALVALALPASAEESPLAPVPARAPFVVHLRGALGTEARLLALVQKALPAETARLVKTKFEQALKEALDGRALKGLPPDGPIFLAFLKFPTFRDDLSQLALIVRVTKYADFRDGLLKAAERTALVKGAGYEKATIGGQAVYFVDRGRYAVIAFHEDTAGQFTKRQPGLDGKLDADAARRFLAADLSAYVDMPAFVAEYGAEIRAARATLDQALQQAMQVRERDLAGAEMVKKMSSLFFQATEDSRAVLLLADFRPAGLALHASTQIGADTTTGQFLKGFRPSPLGRLGQLPAGAMTYAALQVEPALLKLFPAWLYGLSPGPDSHANPAVREALRRLTAAGPRARFASARLPLYGTQIWDYQDPAGAVAAHLQLLQALKAGDTFGGTLLREKPDVKARAQTYRGLTLHYVGMTWDIDGMVAAQTPKEGGEEYTKAVAKPMAATLKKLVGEGSKSWFGTDGKVFVQVTAGDWDGARRQLDQYLDGKAAVGRQPAFADTRRRLPAETSVVNVVEASSYVQFLADFLQAAADRPAPSAARAAKGKPAYFGMAITLRPGRGSLDLWLPAAVVGELVRVVEVSMQAA